MDSQEYPAVVKGFELTNQDKVRRALDGTTNRTGEAVGGIRRDDGTWDDNELLALYDKFGGGIRKDGDTVKMGSFYDFKAKAPRKTPQVVLTFRINGKVVDVNAEEEAPALVKAARIIEKDEVEKKKAKKTK